MDINRSTREVTIQLPPNTVTSPWRTCGDILQIKLWGSLRQHLMLPPTFQGRGQSPESCRTNTAQGRLLYLCLTHRVHASVNFQTLDQKQQTLPTVLPVTTSWTILTWYQYKDICGIFSTYFKIPTTYKCKIGTCKAAFIRTGKSEVNPDLCWFQCSIPVPEKAETSRPPVSKGKKGTSVENKVLIYNRIKRHYLATFIQWKNSKNLIKIMDVHPKEQVCQYVYEEIFDKILGVL